MKKYLNLRANIVLGLVFAFLANSIGPIPLVQAQEVSLPAPGVMVHFSPQFTPAHLKGIAIHPENAFKFDFIIDKGDQSFTDSQKKEEYTKLIKYFLASLATPDEDQWVNLSPYEKDRIIKDDFGKTEMGRDLLAQDYLLKQITASLIYPQDKLGQKFWDEIYARAYKQYGTTNIPVNTFNKVWIVPDRADIYEKGNIAYLYKSHLKVMLEEDYLALTKHQGKPAASTLASSIVREIVLPQLEKEVNEDKNFAPLRQVFSGMILAAWYKRALRESLLARIYANKAKVKGVDQDPKNNEAIYQQYLKAYKKGVFNYIREEVDKYTNETIPRKYFSGGAALISQDAPIDPTTGLRVFEALREHPATDKNAAMAVIFSIDRGRADSVAVSLDPNQQRETKKNRIYIVEPFKVMKEREMLQAQGPYGKQTLADMIETLKKFGATKGQVGRFIRKYYENGENIIQLNQYLNSDIEIPTELRIPIWDAVSIVLFDQEGIRRNGREISQYAKFIDDALPDRAQSSQSGVKMTLERYLKIRQDYDDEFVGSIAGFERKYPSFEAAAQAVNDAYDQLSEMDQERVDMGDRGKVVPPTSDHKSTMTTPPAQMDPNGSFDEAMLMEDIIDEIKGVSDEQLNTFIEENPHLVPRDEKEDYKKLIGRIKKLSKDEEGKLFGLLAEEGYERQDFEFTIGKLISIAVQSQPIKELRIKFRQSLGPDKTRILSREDINAMAQSFLWKNKGRAFAAGGSQQEAQAVVMSELDHWLEKNQGIRAKDDRDRVSVQMLRSFWIFKEQKGIYSVQLANAIFNAGQLKLSDNDWMMMGMIRSLTQEQLDKMIAGIPASEEEAQLKLKQVVHAINVLSNKDIPRWVLDRWDIKGFERILAFVRVLIDKELGKDTWATLLIKAWTMGFMRSHDQHVFYGEQELKRAIRNWLGDQALIKKHRSRPEDIEELVDEIFNSMTSSPAIRTHGDVGGIDMNAAHLNMNIKRDGSGVPLPVRQQDLEDIQIDGLVPVILDIRPVDPHKFPLSL